MPPSGGNCGLWIGNCPPGVFGVYGGVIAPPRGYLQVVGGELPPPPGGFVAYGAVIAPPGGYLRVVGQ